MAQINCILHKINYVFFTLLFHIFLVYILNDFLYMYCLLPFPLFTQIYANYVRLGVQRVSLKCQLFIEGTCAVCMCVVFVAQLPEKRSQKKIKRTKIKKQLRAHATFTKASNTPKKKKVNKREKVWKIIIILIKQREKRKKERERGKLLNK